MVEAKPLIGQLCEKIKRSAMHAAALFPVKFDNMGLSSMMI